MIFFVTALYFFPSILSSVVMATYIGTGHTINLSTTFTILVLLDMIKNPIRLLPYFISSFIQFQVSMVRIQKFLDIKEVPFESIVAQDPSLQEQDLAVSIKKKSFSWGVKFEEEKKKKGKKSKQDRLEAQNVQVEKLQDSETSLSMSMDLSELDSDSDSEEKQLVEDKPKVQSLNDIITLKDINLQIKKGQFVCIIGDVGSGKSSLLSAMNGDMLCCSSGLMNKFKGAEGFKTELTDEKQL